MQCENLVPFLLIGVAEFQLKMTVSLARVVLNRPSLNGIGSEQRKMVLILTKRTLVKKPKSGIKAELGMNSAKTPSTSGWSRHIEQLKGPPPKWMKTSFKLGVGLAAFEFILLCAAYLNWRQLNVDQEHRFQMGQSWWGCYLLDAYYRMGEYMDPSNKMRDYDLETWRSEGKPEPLEGKFSLL